MKFLISQFKQILCAAVLILTLFTTSIVSGAIWYVDANAGSNGDGTSESTPFNNLQSGLSSAQNLDTIFIAQGTYKPTTGTNRSISFEISSKNVSLRGGYIVGTPWTHSGNPALTILSGDIGTAGTFTDNSYTVLNCLIQPLRTQAR